MIWQIAPREGAGTGPTSAKGREHRGAKAGSPRRGFAGAKEAFGAVFWAASRSGTRRHYFADPWSRALVTPPGRRFERANLARFIMLVGARTAVEGERS